MIRVILVFCLWMMGECEIDRQQLLAEIQNTEELIQLYSRKRELLGQLYRYHFPTVPLRIQARQLNETQVSKGQIRSSEYLILVKSFQEEVRYLPDHFLLTRNKILDCMDYGEVGEFMGEVIYYQEGRIITLVGRKLGMTVLTRSQAGLVKEQLLLGQTAGRMSSLWHRNFNIKEGEDLLIQWQQNVLFFRGRQSRQMLLSEGEEIINVFSLNQYKVIFVSTRRIGVINSRSLQMGEFVDVRNITRMIQEKERIEIVSACWADNMVLVLMNSGEVARYFNERIIMVQTLSRVKEELQLRHTQIFMQNLGGYLFLADREHAILRIFSIQGGRFHFLLGLSMSKEHSLSHYELFKVNDSIRLLTSSAVVSSIYEVLLPVPEESGYNFSYLKILGVLAVIICFIYFKSTRKEDPAQQMRRQLQRKDLEKPPFRYAAEVQQYLKRKRGEKGKQKAG